jgi:hypothetical protein
MSKSDDDDDESVTVEIRNECNELVREYRASQAEVNAMPLLFEARAALARGDPMSALEAVVSAVRRTEGEQAVMQRLQEAKERAESAREQLLRDNVGIVDDAQMLVDSMQQGDSWLCPRCAGLIKTERIDSHRRLWCPLIDDDDQVDDDSE